MSSVPLRQKYHVCIGYDDRQPEAFRIAKESLLDTAFSPDRITVRKLYHKSLREKYGFNREWTITSDGQYIDNVDRKPFSTQFSHSRFLTPIITRDSADFSVFVDCDVLFQKPLDLLLDSIKGEQIGSPLYVVKHDYNPKEKIKMDNCVQSNYNMKLWSAFMIFDNRHTDNLSLTLEDVNRRTGRELHNFFWIKGDTPQEKSQRIGSIDEEWQFIPDHSEKNTGLTGEQAAMIHYTEGGPWFKHYEDCTYSDLYYKFYHKSHNEERKGYNV